VSQELGLQVLDDETVGSGEAAGTLARRRVAEGERRQVEPGRPAFAALDDLGLDLAGCL
jgi:hypothetical protein